METKTVHLIRFCLMPLAVVAVFVLSAFLSLMIAKRFGLWEEAFMGFCSALAVVVSAWWVSPSHRLTVAIAWFFLGAISASVLLANPIFTEASANQRTPLFITCLGGALGIAFCYWLEKKPGQRR